MVNPQSYRRRIVFLVLLFFVFGLSTSVRAADNSPGSAGSRSFDSAQARLRDAETLKTLTAEGQVLYRRDRVRLDGYRYCSQAVVQAERGELRESIRSASKALHVGLAEGNDDLVALSKRDLAIAYSYAGDLDSAERYAREALQHAAKDPAIVAGPAFKTLGDVAVRRGRVDEAIELYGKAGEAASERFRPLVDVSMANAYLVAGKPAQARALYERLPAPEPALKPMYGRGFGNLLLAEGQAAEAGAAFEAAAADAAGPDADYHRLWALEGLARSWLARGDRTAARRHYVEAARLSELIRARFRSEEFKTGLFGDMQDIFEQAIALSMESGDSELAWGLSERSRGRALLDTLRGRVSAEGRLEAAMNAVELARLQAELGAREAVVQYHSLEDRLIAWVITPGALQGFSLPISRAELESVVDGFRQSIFRRRSDTRALAQALHERLIAPLGLAGERDQLIVVPHGALHYLPFQALTTPDGSFLIEHKAIAVAPSASVAVQLSRRSRDPAGALVAFGNPSNQAREGLPGAEREVEQISALFSDRRVYFREQASKSRFRESAGAGRILHVAAHAEVDSVDPLHSRILLAAEGDDPGFLEAREVYGVDLQGVALVTLSACESGLGRIARGDEIQGFTRSFLTAGAAGLLASLWPVADDSTEFLMTHFYGKFARGTSSIEAMRDAQVATLREPKFAHPFFWAPFNLIGDWRLRGGA